MEGVWWSQELGFSDAWGSVAPLESFDRRYEKWRGEERLLGPDEFRQVQVWEAEVIAAGEGVEE